MPDEASHFSLALSMPNGGMTCTCTDAY